MNSFYAKDGCTLTVMNDTISVSNGEVYNYFDAGHVLVGNGQSFHNVGSIDEAIGMILGLHGGRRI